MTMRLFSTATAIAVATGALLIPANAFALAADNDGYAGRALIGSTPFTATADTTTATTDSDDTDLNRGCGALATDASVWYEYTATTDGAIVIDVAESDYTAGILVGVGGSGNWTLVACGYRRVGLPTTAGQPYAILAIDYQKDGGGNGGALRFQVSDMPPPVIDVTVDPTGTVDPRTGIANLSGTVTCTGGPAQFAWLEAQLQQNRHRFTVFASNATKVTCDATTRHWTLAFESPNGPFGQGLASNVTSAYACGEFLCGTDEEQRDTPLRHR